MSTVFISGISRGIGLGLASRYLADGHTVVGSIRSENAEVDQLASRYPDTLTVVKLNVARRNSVDAAARQVAGAHDALDLLICSAAVNPAQAGDIKALADIDDQEILDTSIDSEILRTIRGEENPDLGQIKPRPAFVETELIQYFRRCVAVCQVKKRRTERKTHDPV